MTSEIVRSDFRGLNNFIKGISARAQVRVGIFGSKSKRKEGVLTNAEVGAIHEFGSFSRGIPPRSFLRLPLFQKSDDIIEDASRGALRKLADGDNMGILRTLGFACVKAIQEAFATAGFGAWAPNTPSTIRRKGSSAPLIDVGELRRSITSKAEKL
jgi:phage gpG-like protein